MIRALKVVALATLLLTTLAACGGGGGGTPAPDNGGLYPLDFDLVSDPGSVPSSEAVSGRQVDLGDEDWASSITLIPTGQKVVGGILLEPESAPGAGFSGDITVRLDSRLASQVGSADGCVYLIVNGQAIELSPVTKNGNSYSFHLNALGLLIITENDGPQFSVSAFADLSSAAAGDTINFWAVARNAVEPVTFNWTFGDGASATGDAVSHAYAAAGDYSVTLSATDAEGNNAPVASTPITITEDRIPLDGVTVAVTPIGGNEYNFSATAEGGTPPLSYSWDFDGDGTEDSNAGANVNFTYPADGIYTGTLTVTDGAGDTTSDDYFVYVRNLVLTATPQAGSAPLTVEFDINGGPAGETYVMNFGDGGPSNEVTFPVNRTYQEGVYQASVTATVTVDGVEMTAQSNTVQIDVDAAPAPAFIQLTQPINPEPGSQFRIYRQEFGPQQHPDRRVMLNGNELEVIESDESSLLVQLEAGDTGGELTITAPWGDSNDIQVSLAGESPAGIQNVLALDTAPDAPLLIIGHGFGDTPAAMTIGGVEVTPEAWGDNAISARMPSELVDGLADIELLLSNGELAWRTHVSAAAPSGPTLNNIEPEVYELGTGDIELSGFAFGAGGPNDHVLVAGLLQPVSEWNNTRIVITAPIININGPMAVIRGREVSNGMPFTAAVRPEITSIAPQRVPAGTDLTITGTNFGTQDAGDKVVLEDVELTVVSWSDIEIIVTIPIDAEDGALMVMKKLSSNPVSVDVIPPTPGQPNLDQI